MHRTIHDGLIYGTVGFSAGFVLGVLREVSLIPMLGAELGRLIEFAVATIAIVAVGWWLVARRRPARSFWSWFGVGLLGVATLLLLESALALLVLDMPLGAYLAEFDVRQGALFPIGLLVMVLAPAILGASARH
ncbi:MAG: hypothetical protein R3D57_06660 [Hyphomicrobiaceae bacterium]